MESLFSSVLILPPLIPAGLATCLGLQGKDPELTCSRLGQAKGGTRGRGQALGAGANLQSQDPPGQNLSPPSACLQPPGSPPGRPLLDPEDAQPSRPLLPLTAGTGGRTGPASSPSIGTGPLKNPATCRHCRKIKTHKLADLYDSQCNWADRHRARPQGNRHNHSMLGATPRKFGL